VSWSAVAIYEPEEYAAETVMRHESHVMKDLRVFDQRNGFSKLRRLGHDGGLGCRASCSEGSRTRGNSVSNVR
jgi:hypothetical protein